MVPDDAIVAFFRVILVYTQRDSGKYMEFCYHLVYACRFG